MMALVHCFIKRFARLLVVGLATAPVVVSAGEVSQVLTSIKPLKLIVEEITRGTGIKVDYLMTPTVSEHNYALKVSDIKKLGRAGLVVWLGPEMEPYLESSLNNWAPGNGPAKSLPVLAGVISGETTHQDEATGFDRHHGVDPHVWLSPPLALQVAKQVSDRLGLIYPRDKLRFEDNLNTFSRKILVLDRATARSLENHKNKPFFVYHSAYGYFVKQYGLNQVGALHAQPGAVMSLKQLDDLQRVMEKQVQEVCLFREPQFGSVPVPVFKSKNPIKAGELDPLGINADSYEMLIGNLAKGFLQCFTQGKRIDGAKKRPDLLDQAI